MFNEYPYTDYHELNTDWIIGKIKNVETAEANTKQYAEDADAAKVAAEDAKDIAVQAKEDAVSAKDDAEHARDSAQAIVHDTQDQIDLLQSRVDNIIPDGTQTAGNTELLDIRVGADGITYDSAGNAVRGQFDMLQDELTNSVGIMAANALFADPVEHRKWPISVNLKAGVEYTFAIDDYPTASINFYTGSDYSSGYLGSDHNFNSTRKVFKYTFASDITTLYLVCWATVQPYMIYIYNNQSAFDQKISDASNAVIDRFIPLENYKEAVDFSSASASIPTEVVECHANSLLKVDGTLGTTLSSAWVSDFISIDEYDIQSMIYGFYESGNTYAGIACYSSASESDFIASYRTYDSINPNGWATGTAIPSFPSNARYIRIAGRDDQAPGSPSIIAIRALPKINESKIANHEQRIQDLEDRPVITTTTYKAKPLIFDTDFGGDIDDLSALALALWAERAGMVDIIGVESCVPRQGTNGGGISYNEISAMDAVCNYFGVSDMAFGTNSVMATRTSNYCGACCTYEHSLTGRTDCDDAPEFYRKALVSIPDDEKCNVVVVGQTTAFSRFLQSPADGISPLTGLQLAAAKIDKLVIMGGSYPTGSVETNFSGYGAVPYTDYILQNYPGKLYLIGGEMFNTHCGDVLYDDNLTWSILYDAMNEFMVDAFNGGSNPWGYTTLEQTWKGKDYAWDCIATIVACDNNFATSGAAWVQGVCSIDADPASPDYGKNSWSDDPTGHHYYFRYQTGRSHAWCSHRFDSIIAENAWPSRPVGRLRLPRN